MCKVLRFQSASKSSKAQRSGPEILVLIGTFAGPIAQWLIFLLVARKGGTDSAGELAILVAIGTPLFTITNLGLRNGFITLQERYGFGYYMNIRLMSVASAAVVLIAIGIGFQLTITLLLLVTAQKVADAVLDLELGLLQRHSRTFWFGLIMTLNGLITCGLALVAMFANAAVELIVASSAAGSLVALLIATFYCRYAILEQERRLVGPSGKSRPYGRIVRLCLPIGVGQIVAIVIVNVPFWGVAMAGDADDIGRFASAAYLITVGSLLGSALNAVVISKYQGFMAAGDSLRVAREARMTTYLLTAAGLVLVLVVMVFGPALFSLVYGVGFQLSSVDLTLIALAAVLNPATHVLNAALLAVNAYFSQLAIVMWALLATGATWLFCISYGVDSITLGGLTALAGSLIKLLASLVVIKSVGNSRIKDEAGV